MIERFIKGNVFAAIKDTPVVIICGPRQSGKSTLARQLVSGGLVDHYISLDQARNRELALADPAGFLTEYERSSVAIDEIQRVPSLMTEIKATVDSDRRPGRFLLTGSSNVLQLPSLSDSLAGRTELLTLWPFAQAEIESRRSNLVELLFSGERPPAPPPTSRGDVITRMLTGGFPESVARDMSRRRKWFRTYIRSVADREVRELAHVRALQEFPALLRLLAGRTGGITNYAGLADGLEISQDTVKRYIALMEATYQIIRLRPYSPGLNSREVKSTKILLADPGMMASVGRITTNRIDLEIKLFGSLFENFVTTELVRHGSFAPDDYDFFHYRSREGQEADLIIEDPEGRIVAIEIKAGVTTRADHFTTLRTLRDQLGPKFVSGAVINLGPEVMGYGDRLVSVPASTLWSD